VKRGYFRKIFIVYAFVLVGAVFFSEVYVTGIISDSYLDSLRYSLSVQARLIAGNLDFGAAGQPDAKCGSLKKTTGARVTLVSAVGRVLCDSDAVSGDMENHGDRPEIQQAYIDGVGSSIRFSKNVNSKLLYLALGVRGDKGILGYVRLSLPLDHVMSSINSIRVKVLLGVFLVLLVPGIVSVLQTGRVRTLVSDVTGFSGAIAKGDFSRRLLIGGAGEFDQIARNLNSMAVELSVLVESDREKYERLGAILKSVPDALLITGSDAKVAMYSSASERFLGTSRLARRPIKEIVRAPGFIGMIDEVRRGGLPSEREIGLAGPEEKTAIVKVSPIRLAERGDPGLVVLFHEITEAKKLEQVRKDFVANVSHELKTPIAAIKGFADTLAEGAMEDRENAARFVGIIQANSQRMVKLVEDLMTISRLELGVLGMEMESVSLARLAGDVFDNFRSVADEKGLELKFSPDVNIADVQADPDRLVQIISNLVDNSIKYTESGSVTIGSGFEDGRPFIYVSDTGPGVARKHIPRLGERFYRVDTSRSRELGGTGLGLAIVKHLVISHGWEMIIQSSPGKDMTVRIFV